MDTIEVTTVGGEWVEISFVGKEMIQHGARPVIAIPSFVCMSLWEAQAHLTDEKARLQRDEMRSPRSPQLLELHLNLGGQLAASGFLAFALLPQDLCSLPFILEDKASSWCLLRESFLGAPTLAASGRSLIWKQGGWWQERPPARQVYVCAL